MKRLPAEFCGKLRYLVLLWSHRDLMIRRISATERPGRVGNTPASYSGGPGFDSRPRPRPFLIEIFVVLLSPSRQISG
jgi:hypothetical protein